MHDSFAARRVVLGLAERQWAHVARRQLLAAGVGSAWIRSQLRLGRLIAVHQGVYAVGHVPHHPHARATAALLACGEQAALSHSAAAALWGVLGWPRTLEVVAPGERRRPGIRSHRCPTLTAGDVRRHEGIRVTSPARTVLDLQSRLTDAALVRMVNDLRVAGHLRPGAFAELCARSARVARLLGEPDPRPEQRPTRSVLEDRFRAFVRRHGLPLPEINVRLAHNGREVDALYRDQRVIIEVDSWTFHRSRASFERDRAIDADALGHGYRTLRITDDRLERGGAEEADRIARILGV